MKYTGTSLLGLTLAIGTGIASFAQGVAQNGPQVSSSQEAPSPGWHRFGERAPADSAQMNTGRPAQQPAAQYTPPASLTVPAGTWITVRMNQALSTDRNQSGDAFTASLAEPIIAQGLVVAHRGQTVGGRVTDSQKAGRVKGTSQLGVELTELSLSDGQQTPVKTQFIERRGDTSVGRDAGAVGVTTGLGALIGAAAGGGFGAGIGAAAGAVVSTTGVLVTRGRPTVIYPETVLTFRLEQPLTVTSQAMQAFQPPTPQDNNRPAVRNNTPPRPYGAPYPAYPAPAYYGYGYPYAYGPSVYFGPTFFYGGRGFYGRRW